MATKGVWKYGILLFDSFLLFGPLFCIDLPSVLQHEFIDSSPTFALGEVGSNFTSVVTKNGGDCEVCLGLGEVRYNLLHSSLRWTSAILCLPMGYIIDKLGNSRSAGLLTSVTFLGSVLFATGVVSGAPTTKAMFLMMLLGRILLAFGEGPLLIVQDRVVAHWFSDNSFVPLAFLLLGRRGGTLLACFISANMAESIGFGFSVWFGAILTGFGIVCALCLTVLSFFGTKEQDVKVQECMKDKSVNIKDLKLIPGRFWLHVAVIATAYGAYFTFFANVTNYLQLRYGYSMVHAAHITGATQIAPLFAPFIASLMRRLDCNGIVVTCAVGSMIPVYILLGYCPSIHPLILLVPIGFSYAIFALILWQVAVVVSPASCFGTVAGIAFLIRNTSISFTMLCGGYILEGDGNIGTKGQLQRYENFFLALVVLTAMSVTCGIVLNVLDIRSNCVINQRFRKWKGSYEAVRLFSNENEAENERNGGDEYS